MRYLNVSIVWNKKDISYFWLLLFKLYVFMYNVFIDILSLITCMLLLLLVKNSISISTIFLLLQKNEEWCAHDNVPEIDSSTVCEYVKKMLVFKLYLLE